ncbi:MAG: alpha/beta hydrolase [Clostridiales bacterium]|mgnify:CR=1 FL=1|nr:alpha/beta hydrolase [Clostridiales bacterium]
MKHETFRSVTGAELDKAVWEPDTAPKAVVQLVHGMCEYIDRYDETAQRLNQAGYLVVGHTHLGHGEKAEQLGYFAHENGWDALIEDVHSVRTQTQKEYPDLPYFLLGHSMGSFVTRTYCLKHEAGLKGVALSGTGHFDKLTVGLAKTIASLQCALGMAQKPSRLLEKLSSGGNNRGYQNVQTPFDWLSRDRQQVQRYMQDPYCGFTFTASAYRDMFEGLSRLYPEKLGAMDKQIPILLFAGDMDPVGSHGEGVKLVAEELKAAGVQDITLKLYEDGRHEMFNELNREQVWTDLVEWLDSKR